MPPPKTNVNQRLRPDAGPASTGDAAEAVRSAEWAGACEPAVRLAGKPVPGDSQHCVHRQAVPRRGAAGAAAADAHPHQCQPAAPHWGQFPVQQPAATAQVQLLLHPLLAQTESSTSHEAE